MLLAGARGTGATGRPVRSCAMNDITQKKWERNLPGINTEAVALPDAARTGNIQCDVIAGWRLRLTRPTESTHRLTPVGPCKRAAGQQYPALPTSPWQSEQRPHQNRQPLRHLLSSTVHGGTT